MALTTLDRFLRQGGKRTETAGPKRAEAADPNWIATLAHVLRTVHDAAAEDPSAHLDGLTKLCQAIESGGHEDPARVAAEFSSWYKNWNQARRSRQAEELRRLFNTLTDAIQAIGTGGDRGSARLDRLDQDLQRAASLPSVTAVRERLTQIVTFVRSEKEKEAAETLKAISGISTRVEQSKQSFAVSLGKREGRDEAIRDLEQRFTPDGNAGAIVLVVEKLRVIEVRYNSTVAEELVDRLIAVRIAPVFGDSIVYRWSPDSLVLFFDKTAATPELSTALGDLAAPFEHRVFLGSRFATLVVTLKWVTIPLTGLVGDQILEIDRFAGVSV